MQLTEENKLHSTELAESGILNENKLQSFQNTTEKSAGLFWERALATKRRDTNVDSPVAVRFGAARKNCDVAPATSIVVLYRSTSGRMYAYFKICRLLHGKTVKS